jgi:hypothetical protein
MNQGVLKQQLDKSMSANSNNTTMPVVSKPPRLVTAIIPKLLEVIPSTETTLIAAISKYNNSLWNVAPELLSDGYYWQPLGRILGTYVHSLDEPWQQQLQKIFNDTA